jgi:hypothetical protein
MQYALLAYRNEQRWQALPASERAAFAEACQASQQDLSQSRRLMEVMNLEDEMALRVSIVDGMLALTGGAVAGIGQRLIQILVIRAWDLNIAIQIAARLQQARAGR